MLGQHHRDAAVAVDAGDQRQQLLGRNRVELAGRLVEQQERLPHRQHRCDCDPLPLAAGQRAGVALGQMGGTGGHQRLLGAGGNRGRWMSDALQPERHLVAHPLGDQLRLGILEHQAGVAGQLARAVVARVQAVDRHAAGQLAAVEVRHEAERGPQQRRLAAARLADDQHQLAGLDVQGDAVQRRLGHARVRVADVHEAQRGHRTAPMTIAVSAANAAEPPIAAAVTGSPSRS